MNVKSLALQRIHRLFKLAFENVNSDPNLAERCVEIARRIAMKARVRLPREYRRFVCRGCKRFILPGINSRVRIQQRREPHVSITCLLCGHIMRYPLRGRRNGKESKFKIKEES